MSMMRLYIDKPLQPSDNETATYPIYELDLQGLADAGMVSWGRGGQVTNAVNECFCLSGGVNNANVNRYLSTNIPHQQWQDGSILQAKISKYALNENNVYVPDTDYYDFEEIPIGQQPADWGTASNILKYMVASNATIDGQTVTYRAYYNIRKTETWDASAQYVRDKNRKIIRLFYTGNGYSFGVYQGADCEGGSQVGPVFNVAGYSQYSYDFSNPYESRYIWCNPSGNRLYIGGNVISMQLACYSRIDSSADNGLVIAGRNTVAASFFIFVHTFYNDKDYYGTLCIYPNDFTESSTFNQINFLLYTSEFWGGSITSGGNAGKWGDVSVAGGGDGTFTYTSDNRGDTIPTSIETIIGARISNIYSVMSAYNKFVVTPSEFSQIMAVLQGTDYISRFQNTMFNPLSAILAINWIPSELCAESTDTAVLTASGFNISEHINHVEPPQFKKNKVIAMKSFAPLDFTTNENKFSDSFADYEPYTKAILHLPYIGEVELSVNAFMHGKLKVTYVCDNISGNCVAFVWCSDRFGNCTYKYTISGNCAYTLPAFATRQDGSAVGKLIGSAVGMASGNIMTGVIQGVGALARIAHPKHSTSITSSFGGNVGIIGDSICWLEIIHPVWIEPSDYRQLNGIPSELSGTLADDGSDDHVMYDGYTVVSEIHLENVDCTENEKAMIESALKRGVHIHADRY